MMLCAGLFFTGAGLLGIVFPQEGVISHAAYMHKQSSGEYVTKEKAANYGLIVFLVGNGMLGLCYYLWREDVKVRGDLKP